MKIVSHFILLYAGVLFLTCCGSPSESVLREEIAGLNEHIKLLENAKSAQAFVRGNIKHTVMFNLKHEPDAEAVKKFLQDGQRILSALPMVRNFEMYKQVSLKNNYQFCFTMIFNDQAAYQAYNDHPDHVKFVKERWDMEVSEFLEADFIIP